MPPQCVFCGTRCRPGERCICQGCLSDLPWVENACALCAAPVGTALPYGVHCADCQSHPPEIQATVAPLLYEFPVDAGLKALKFGRSLYYAPAFAELLLLQLPRLFVGYRRALAGSAALATTSVSRIQPGHRTLTAPRKALWPANHWRRQPRQGDRVSVGAKRPTAASQPEKRIRRQKRVAQRSRIDRRRRCYNRGNDAAACESAA